MEKYLQKYGNNIFKPQISDSDLKPVVEALLTVRVHHRVHSSPSEGHRTTIVALKSSTPLDSKVLLPLIDNTSLTSLHLDKSQSVPHVPAAAHLGSRPLV